MSAYKEIKTGFRNLGSLVEALKAISSRVRPSSNKTLFVDGFSYSSTSDITANGMESSYIMAAYPALISNSTVENSPT